MAGEFTNPGDYTTISASIGQCLLADVPHTRSLGCLTSVGILAHQISFSTIQPGRFNVVPFAIQDPTALHRDVCGIAVAVARL